jgi:hypothetical protein
MNASHNYNRQQPYISSAPNHSNSSYEIPRAIDRLSSTALDRCALQCSLSVKPNMQPFRSPCSVTSSGAALIASPFDSSADCDTTQPAMRRHADDIECEISTNQDARTKRHIDDKRTVYERNADLVPSLARRRVSRRRSRANRRWQQLAACGRDVLYPSLVRSAVNSQIRCRLTRVRTSRTDVNVLTGRLVSEGVVFVSTSRRRLIGADLARHGVVLGMVDAVMTSQVACKRKRANRNSSSPYLLQ